MERTKRHVVDGYQKFVDYEEMNVLEPEDWSPAEWEALCKLCGLPAHRTERIVLRLKSIECYINPEEKSKQHSQKGK